MAKNKTHSSLTVDFTWNIWRHVRDKCRNVEVVLKIAEEHKKKQKKHREFTLKEESMGLFENS